MAEENVSFEEAVSLSFGELLDFSNVLIEEFIAAIGLNQLVVINAFICGRLNFEGSDDVFGSGLLLRSWLG